SGNAFATRDPSVAQPIHYRQIPTSSQNTPAAPPTIAPVKAFPPVASEITAPPAAPASPRSVSLARHPDRARAAASRGMDFTNIRNSPLSLIAPACTLPALPAPLRRQARSACAGLLLPERPKAATLRSFSRSPAAQSSCRAPKRCRCALPYVFHT